MLLFDKENSLLSVILMIAVLFGLSAWQLNKISEQRKEVLSGDEFVFLPVLLVLPLVFSVILVLSIGLSSLVFVLVAMVLLYGI